MCGMYFLFLEAGRAGPAPLVGAGGGDNLARFACLT